MGEIQILLVSIRTVKTLATVKNRLFFGNISTALDFDFDPSDATVSNVEYLVPSDIHAFPSQDSTGQTKSFSGHGMANTSGVSQTGGILVDGWYKVFGTGSITYDATVYVVGDTFQGV